MTPEKPVVLHLFQSRPETSDRFSVFSIDTDPAPAGAHSIRAYEHSFQDRVGILLQQGLDDQREGIAFCGITDQMLLVSRCVEAQTPCFRDTISISAPLPEAGSAHLFDHSGWG